MRDSVLEVGHAHLAGENMVWGKDTAAERPSNQNVEGLRIVFGKVDCIVLPFLPFLHTGT